MHYACNRARKKLDMYNSKVTDEPGNFYNFGNNLNPSCKLTAYESDPWDKEQPVQYRANFISTYETHNAIAEPSTL